MFERSSAAASAPKASAWTVQFPLNEMEVGLQSISATAYGKHGSKRRFDDTQVRSLETIFETEARPELRVKQQLANKLGLQPRQVAIWFQNKRARSKSKQIEREYNVLKASYDSLASKYESLKKENESLLIQVEKLRTLTAKMDSEEHHDKEDIKLVINDKLNFPLETYSTQLNMSICHKTNDDELDYLGQKSTGLDVAQIADVSLTSPENGCSLESTDLVDNSSCNSNWWEF
ncbi:hypothetical protein M9H77_25056 [Catharanthus roseus]|uniref:Uncharacterized protein n=1 Tax=Catharanthus roseus TaxID=4058 RepID=A0ACC0A5U5_CATRO|nr:hypothetical protein M9H77_25056 [Catharanthus roseus]